ncbi:MAG: hypothetical protein ACYDAI_18055 [Trichloromonadaceae bacterium]
MKKLRNILIVMLAAGTLALAGCGGGGGGGGGGAGDGGVGGGGNGGVGNPTPVTTTTFSTILLDDRGGSFSAGIAINDSGMAVGLVDDGSSIKGAKWAIAGATPTAIVLAPLIENNYSAAYGINALGTVVGESGATVNSTADANTVAVYWKGSAVTQLPAPTDNLGAYAAYSINASDLIVGESVKDAQGNTKAVLWLETPTGWAILDTLHQDGWDYSAAYFIHDDGLIVGEAKPNGGSPQGVVWTPAAGDNYTVTLLPPLTGGASSVAFGIDTQGRIVGESETGNGTVNGVIWTVNTLGTVITATQDLGANSSAQALNDAERVVGYSGAGSTGSLLWNLANLADFKALTLSARPTASTPATRWSESVATGPLWPFLKL